MLNISKNHLTALRWFNSKTNILEYSHLKIQKFLYFYEMFQMVDDKIYDINNLKAYKNGPVFSDVYGDYCYRKEKLLNTINHNEEILDSFSEDNAEKARFLVSTLTDDELSKLTHNLDMWSSKEKQIDLGEKHIPINTKDITERDKIKIKNIKRGCSNLKYYKVLNVLNKIFLLDKNEEGKLTDEHYEVLERLSNVDELYNPVYINIDEKGVILVD